jgi:glycosyltransferase involved in cell wall biosynthesis
MAEATRTLKTDHDTPRVLRALATRPLDLSIAIVTWNSERWIDRCLQSIAAACGSLAYEVIVYDNASSDATLAAIGDEVEVIRGAANDGFAAGVNRVVTRASGRYFFLLNPDCELAPRALEILVEFLDANPGGAAAVGRGWRLAARVSTAPPADAGYAGERGLRHRQAFPGQPDDGALPLSRARADASAAGRTAGRGGAAAAP